MAASFRSVRRGDGRTVRDIYNHYVVSSTATYHDRPLSTGEVRRHFQLSSPLTRAFIVLENERSRGFGVLKPYSPKEGYRYTYEITIYLAPDACGRGLGKQTLAFLENEARALGLHTLIAGIAGENEASRRLFEKGGYRLRGELVEVGLKFGRRLGTRLFQKMLADR